MSNLKSQSRALRRMVPGDCNAQVKTSPCGVLKKATTGRLFPGSAVDRWSSMSTITSSPMDGCQAGSAKKAVATNNWALTQFAYQFGQPLPCLYRRCLAPTDSPSLIKLYHARVPIENSQHIVLFFTMFTRSANYDESRQTRLNCQFHTSQRVRLRHSPKSRSKTIARHNPACLFAFELGGTP